MRDKILTLQSLQFAGRLLTPWSYKYLTGLLQYLQNECLEFKTDISYWHIKQNTQKNIGNIFLKAFMYNAL